MASYIKTLKEDNGDITYPQTLGSAVLLTGGADLETELGKFVTAEDIATTSALTPPVQTAMIADGAVTSAKIDWSTVVHGTSPASGTINTNSGTSISVTIPTQANTNYTVIITETNSSGAWSWIASRVINKTTTGFTIDLYNNSAQWTATSMTFDYLVIP